MTLVELLAEYAGVALETRRDDPCLQGALLIFANEQRLIVVEGIRRTSTQLARRKPSRFTALSLVQV